MNEPRLARRSNGFSEPDAVPLDDRYQNGLRHRTPDRRSARGFPACSRCSNRTRAPVRLSQVIRCRCQLGERQGLDRHAAQVRPTIGCSRSNQRGPRPSARRSRVRTGRRRKAEDEGYLLTYVYDAHSESSECVIYDAATMSDDPIAAIHLPRVPFGFHGSWVDATVAD